MKESMPLISIILPTFNRSELIAETLQSLQIQSYQNWECIIVDDFSTDNINEVVQGFINYDNRFKIIPNKRKKGAQGARNTWLAVHAG